MNAVTNLWLVLGWHLDGPSHKHETEAYVSLRPADPPWLPALATRAQWTHALREQLHEVLHTHTHTKEHMKTANKRQLLLWLFGGTYIGYGLLIAWLNRKCNYHWSELKLTSLGQEWVIAFKMNLCVCECVILSLTCPSIFVSHVDVQVLFQIQHNFDDIIAALPSSPHEGCSSLQIGLVSYRVVF